MNGSMAALGWKRMRQKIFLDTEFTDFLDTHLISIGMICDTGEHFYAEVTYPMESCSPFVFEQVMPLLGLIKNSAVKKEELSSAISEWLQSVRKYDSEIEICFDYQYDWDLFTDSMDYRIPDWCFPRFIRKDINEQERYNFYRSTGLPMHHALYDAMANRYAFRE